MSSHVRLRDRWWLMNYTWHRWRLMCAARSMVVHGRILQDMGVDLERLKVNDVITHEQ